MAFFLEATFVGLFFFGWNKLSKGAHLTVTWLLALGSNLSALWILIANGWMQHPTGAVFNYHTMRMEVENFAQVIFNPVAQAKFVHTVSAGYVTGAIFVLAISAFYLLRHRNVEIAKRSMLMAATFGLAVTLSAVTLGDESGYLANENQQMKIAAMEGMWDTEKPPAAISLFAIPDDKTHETKYAIQIPYVLGLIATRSISEPVLGINELVAQNKVRIEHGITAYAALNALKQNDTDVQAQKTLAQNANDLGYGLLLKKYTEAVIDATPEQIEQAAWDTVPSVFALFWSFRVMVACGFFFIFLFAVACYFTLRNRFDKRWFLWLSLLSLPLPWIACEVGWFVAEHGRQPWVIEGILPTFLGTSSLSYTDLSISLFGFVLFYTLLAIVEFYLMVKYIRLGPDGMNGTRG
jgi:cytochrome d ubiquinol oxidase subunit I